MKTSRSWGDSQIIEVFCLLKVRWGECGSFVTLEALRMSLVGRADSFRAHDLVACKEANQVVERNYHDVTAHRPQSPPINLHILQKASSGFFLITSSEEKEEENLCENPLLVRARLNNFFSGPAMGGEGKIIQISVVAPLVGRLFFVAFFVGQSNRYA
jgi:hypothetical protein